MTSACPSCGGARPHSGRFCEQCGTELSSPPASPGPEAAPPSPGPGAATASSGPPAGGTGPAWEVRAEADRAYFDKVEADGVEFPAGAPPRAFALQTERATIGRGSAGRGIHPDIDLSGPPTDSGVSHEHAVLVLQSGGTWAILDPGSTNGTYLNGSSEAIPRDQLVPIVEGDQIHIGAWTTLTLHPTGQ